MDSIFNVEVVAYDKKKVRQIVFFLNKANVSQRQNNIDTLLREINKLDKIFKKSKKGINKTKRKINLKQKRKELKNLRDVQMMKRVRVDDYKILLFKMMKKLIVKNILNYQKYTTNSSVSTECFNNVEMESEAYLVMDKCIQNFDWKNKKYDFYYYYNSSLNRNFFRMFDRERRKKEKKDNYFVEKKHTSNKDISNDGDVQFLIEQLGLSEIEMKILQSKLIGERKDDFLKKNNSISSSKYYSILKNIKQLIIKMQNNDEF